MPPKTVGKKISMARTSKVEVPSDEAKQRGRKKSSKKESSIPIFASCYFCMRCNEEFDLRLELKAHKKEGCNLAEFSKVTEDAEFDMYFELISNSDITVGEERNHLVSLIKKRRKFLVKRLVLQMTGLGMGKSKVFKSLSAQYLKLKEDKARILEEQGSGVVLEN